MEGGSPWFTLSAGYIGSTLLGGVFILGGWDTLVAKVMSFVLGVGLVLPLVLVRDKLYVTISGARRGSWLTGRYRTIVLTICYEALLIGFWFIDHAYVLDLQIFSSSR